MACSCNRCGDLPVCVPLVSDHLSLDLDALPRLMAALCDGAVLLGAEGQVLDVMPPQPPVHETVVCLRADRSPCPRDKWPAAIALATGQPVLGSELGLLLADGSEQWRLVNAVPMPAQAGLAPGVLVSFCDVTERRRETDELRQREAQRREIIEGTTDAMFTKDRAGRYLMANSSTLRYLGLPSERVIGRDDRDLMPPAEALGVMAQDNAIMEAGEVRTHEEWLTLGGQRRLFLSTKGPVLDSQGRVAGLFGVSRDITGRADEERRVRQGEARLRVMLRLSQALAEPFDLPGVLQMVVDGSTQLLGLESGAIYLRESDTATLAATCPPLPADFPDALRTLALTDHPLLMQAMAGGLAVMVPDVRGAVLSPAEEAICAMRGLRSLTFVPLVTSERSVGALILGSTSGPRVLDEEDLELSGGFAGQAAQTIENMRLFEAAQRHAEALAAEVVERRRAEVAWAAEARLARDSEERFRALFEQAGDFAFVMEHRPGQAPIITDANDAACRAHGYEREELVGQPISLLADDEVPPDSEGGPIRLVAGETRRFETTHRRKDGSTFPVEVTLTMLARTHGAPVIFSIERDITDRVEARSERERLLADLAQAQKMESVGRLAGGIAHDFNNMLCAIHGYAEMALLDAQQPETLRIEALRDDIEQVLKACRRSADLTRQLLAFARRQTITPMAQDLNQTVGNMLAMLRRLIGENIELVWRPAASLWTVHVDTSQMDQILANLCVNASDAIDGLGSIAIETRNVWLDEAGGMDEFGCAPGEYVELRVTDSGCGMSAEVLDRVFEPFFTTKEVGEGTGLGLATVYGAVRQNGGFISVTSEPGHGSAFSIYLPRHYGAADAAAEDERPVETRGAGETILLVEDDPSILAMVARLLRNYGYTVLATGCAREALRLARADGQSIDLLLTDVIMPQMDGRQLAEAVSEHCPRARCLYMSGYPDDHLARHGVMSDRIQLISKPFSMSELARRVRSLLDS